MYCTFHVYIGLITADMPKSKHAGQLLIAVAMLIILGFFFWTNY